MRKVLHWEGKSCADGKRCPFLIQRSGKPVKGGYESGQFNYCAHPNFWPDEEEIENVNPDNNFPDWCPLPNKEADDEQAKGG